MRSWGVVWTEAIPLSRDWRCPHCHGWSFIGCVSDDKYDKIVGFSTSQAYVSLAGVEKPGVLIVECPNCFENFSFHITSPEIYRECCAAWPTDIEAE